MSCEFTSAGLLLRKDGLPFSRWAANAPPPFRAAYATLVCLAEENTDELLRDESSSFLLPHSDATELPEAEARALGIPERAPFSLSIQHRGTLAAPDFRFQYQLFKDGRPVIGIKRIGCIVSHGASSWRLSAAHFALLDGMDLFNASLGDSMENRMRVFAKFERFLSEQARSSVNVSGYLATTHVSVAGAFSLRLRVQDCAFRLEPVLHSNAPLDETHPPELLSPEQQSAFLQNHERGRGRYAIGGSHYLVVEDDLQRALDLVAEIQTRSESEQTDFFRNPRSFLRTAYEDSLPEETLSALFVETPRYLSDRVKGIGPWDPPVIPWVKLPANLWLPPEHLGIEFEGVRLKLTSVEALDLIQRVELAIERGEPQAMLGGQTVPATEQTLDALRTLGSLAGTPANAIHRGMRTAAARTVLLIERDFHEYEQATQRHARSTATKLWLPAGLKSTLKPHQESGLNWLQNTWEEGRSGVLLADDMGLGKTLQCLAFLLWLRHARPERQEGHGGFLIVAPTGLLKNWEREYALHLDESGRRLLGPPLGAYGTGITRLRRGEGNDLKRGGATLRTEDLTSAEWVLTTYETLRDYHHSFATVYWQVIAFDEAQKIKRPGTLVSEAAKAMNADFTIAITGTPVENRYADLWSIVNTVDRRSLSLIGAGSLKEFSGKFEASPTEEVLRELRTHLSEPEGRSLMMRRMKHEILEGLPPKTECKSTAAMPPEQARLYAEAVARARGIRERGAMLKALHELRAISLHPWLMNDQDPPDLTSFAISSARVSQCFGFLREIQARGEKVLIFVDSKRMQKWLRIVIPAVFRLAAPPPCISGEVPGIRRQSMVDAFQGLPRGFAAMLLSPRAAGVGLTLTSANNVIHLDRWWNPAVEDQCTDRVYRIGQERAVQVSLPLAKHPDPRIAENSFDLTLDRLMDRKRGQSRDLLDPSAISDQDANLLFRSVCIESDDP